MEFPICQYVLNAKDTNAFDCTPSIVKLLFESMNNSKALYELRANTTLTPQDKNRIKQQLPAICWSAFFADGKRHAESAQSSGLVCMDIDLDPSQKPDGMHLVDWVKAYYDYHFAGREEELDIVFAHISPSCKGLHIVYLAQEGLDTIDANNQRLATKTGCIYDEACKDVGRMMYVSYPSDILYNNLQALENED